MVRAWVGLWASIGMAFAAAACTPEVGSQAWCDMMRDKPRGDWTANEALDFAKSCLLE